MPIISRKLRESSNAQKILHEREPSSLRPGRIAKQCGCGLWFELPRCHANRHHSCSAECAAEKRKANMAAQVMGCAECGREYRPRPNQLTKGQGRFCSLPCSLKWVRRSEAFKAGRVKAVATFRKNYKPKAGPESPCWKGGPEETRRRRTESGAEAAALRRYRAANPHKTREWAQNRRNRKAGRLEYGTIPALMKLQRGLCAYCKCDIHSGYHVDHIVPLARGGKHRADNIQLLCGPCNLRKSDRDPIEFAQLNGRLL